MSKSFAENARAKEIFKSVEKYRENTKKISGLYKLDLYLSPAAPSTSEVLLLDNEGVLEVSYVKKGVQEAYLIDSVHKTVVRADSVQMSETDLKSLEWAIYKAAEAVKEIEEEAREVAAKEAMRAQFGRPQRFEGARAAVESFEFLPRAAEVEAELAHLLARQETREAARRSPSPSPISEGWDPVEGAGPNNHERTN